MSQKLPESVPHPWPHPLTVGSLNRSAPTPFDLRATPAECQAIAHFLELAELSQLRWRGEIVPEGPEGWRMEARLTADLAQTCVVTLEPIPVRVDERITRHFVPDDEAVEIDMDIDADEPDPFNDTIDPGAIAIEILALALDPYPRTAGAEPVEIRATPPGAEALDDTALKPFAGLAALKSKLEGGQES